MGYTSGAKILADIIEEIAVALIATVGGFWTDADVTWTTAVKTGDSARRALKYLNGAEVIYLALEARNTQYSPYDGHAAKGLRVTFSAVWPIGATKQLSSIPFEDNNTTVVADLATLQLTYYLWIESNGFVLMLKPEPTADIHQNSVFIVVERNPNKEYSDGYSNFYCYNILNIWPSLTRIGFAYENIHRSFLRPFAYEWPNVTISTHSPNWHCMSLGNLERSNAFKSAGNGKVYYIKPIVSNNKIEPGGANTAMAPIFQAELWFFWSESMGLIDGDVVAIEGLTTKFLVKSLDSPDSINRLNYAIKYVA